MRDDSQSTFAVNEQGESDPLQKPWRPSWSGRREKPSGIDDETLSALLLLVLSGTEEHQHVAPASERIVSLLSEMEAHPRGSTTDYAVRAGLIKQLSAALTGLREELG
ncbi:hypothetical protein [Acidisoma sp.]|uniref:hypothetical protein n=1 Tax=Acidisoma sp. TaxID=1872115 RepID=UPI003B00CBB5